MPSLEPQKKYSFTTSDALQAALVAYCQEHDIKPSDLIRRAIATMIGHPDLAESVRMGRPKKV